MKKRKRVDFEVEKFDLNPREKKRRKLEAKVKNRFIVNIILTYAHIGVIFRKRTTNYATVKKTDNKVRDSKKNGQQVLPPRSKTDNKLRRLWRLSPF